MLADLTLIQGKLRATFPDASVKLSQIRDHFVVEGEARDPAQIARIIQTITAYLNSVFVEQGRTVTVGQTRQVLGALGGQRPGAGGQAGAAGALGGVAAGVVLPMQPGAAGCAGNRARGRGSTRRRRRRDRRTRSPPTPPLPSSPGRPSRATAVPRPRSSTCSASSARSRSCSRSASPSSTERPCGASVPTSWAWIPAPAASSARRSPGSTNFQGTIGQPGNLIQAINSSGRLDRWARMARTRPSSASSRTPTSSSSLTALRQNGLLKILAEPNLVALNGQLASFLAGGEFPVPVPQVSAARRRPDDHRPVPRVRRPPRLRPLHPRRRRHPAHRRPRGQQHRLHDRRHPGRRRLARSPA